MSDKCGCMTTELALLTGFHETGHHGHEASSKIRPSPCVAYDKDNPTKVRDEIKN